MNSTSTHRHIHTHTKKAEKANKIDEIIQKVSLGIRWIKYLLSSKLSAFCASIFFTLILYFGCHLNSFKWTFRCEWSLYTLASRSIFACVCELQTWLTHSLHYMSDWYFIGFYPVFLYLMFDILCWFRIVENSFQTLTNI